jgi:WD40 repeat protein
MMSEQHENMQPETIDQVIEGGKLSLHDRQMTRLIQHLQVCSQEYAQENERSLDRIWSRLTQRQEHPVFLWAQRQWPQAQPIALPRKERKAMQTHPKLWAINRPASSQPKQPHSLRRIVSISLLVAVGLITIVSFTIFSNVLQPAVLTTGKGTMTGAPRQQQLQQQTAISNGSLVCSVGIDDTFPIGGIPMRVKTVDWSAQGTIVVVPSPNVTMFSAKDCSTKLSKPLPSGYTSASWSPDGNKLVISDASHDTQSVLDSHGNVIAKIPFTGQKVWSPDSTRLIFLSYQASNHQHSVKSVDATNGSDVKTLMVLPADETPLLLSPGGKFLLSTNLNQKVLSIWDVTSGKKVSDIDVTPPPKLFLAWVFSPDGSLLALAGESQVQVYATATGKLVTSFDNGPGNIVNIYLAWSPDGRYLAQCRSAISIDDVNAHKRVATFGQVDGKHGIDTMAWAPDSTGLVSSTSLIEDNDHSQIPVNVWKLN